ncbi:MAG: ribosome-associated translation inhibitor RaiA [Thermoguttaceae bacterium]|nr:ribosome-associated translation inhibitor RaiA [Thermoguttaceae bacterium]
MNVTISTRHGNVSEQTQAHLESKVEKLSRNFDSVTGIDILIDLANREKPNLSVTVKQKNIADAYVAIDNTELLTAMDLALDKLEQQLRKAKEKKIDEHKKS